MVADCLNYASVSCPVGRFSEICLFTIRCFSETVCPPVAGIDGTLKNRMKNTPHSENVHAKSTTEQDGTINALPVILKMKNGHTLVFAIMNQNVLSAAKARAFQDSVCEVMIGH